jgi:hypothetical protein
MKYYRLLYNSLNKKVTGTQFQCITGHFGDMQSENLPFEGKIDFDFDLPIPKLENKAKLTAYLKVMYIDGPFLVLDNDFIYFLRQFNIDETQTWNIEVKQKDKTFYNYSLFYVPKTYHREVIIYEDSEFEIFDYSNNSSIRIEEKISDYDGFLKLRNNIGEENKMLKHTNLILNLSKLDKDYFRLINCPFSGNFVSERLKDAIEKEGFQSMMFEELDEKKFKIKIV